MKKKVDVTFYTLLANDTISSIFTKYAREKAYFYDKENSNFYCIIDNTHCVVPIVYNKDFFLKKTISLYPIGTTIADKKNTINGKITHYRIEDKVYAIKRGSTEFYIPFDSAVSIEIYYFISSSGKVQQDYVGRDKFADSFRKRNNNFFEDKEDANKKLKELNLEFSK